MESKRSSEILSFTTVPRRLKRTILWGQQKKQIARKLVTGVNIARMGENHPDFYIKDRNLKSCTEQDLKQSDPSTPSAFIIILVTDEGRRVWGWAFPLCFASFSLPKARRIRPSPITYHMSVTGNFSQLKRKLGSAAPFLVDGPNALTKGKDRNSTFILPISPGHVRATRSAPPCKRPIQLLQDTWKCFIPSNAEGE